MGISQMYETFRSVVRFKELEFDPVARRLAKIADVADYRAVAKRRSNAQSTDQQYQD